MGFSRQEYWNGLPLPSLGDFSDSGSKPTPSVSAGRLFAIEPPEKPEIQVNPGKKRILRHSTKEYSSETLLRYYHDEYTYTFVKTHKYTTQKVNTSVNYGLL